MIRFYGEDLLAPRPTPKLENHPLFAVRDCLFNIFAATLHTGGCSSIRNLKTRHAVVTGTHLPRYVCRHIFDNFTKNATILSQINPVQDSPSHLLKSDFNIILPSTTRSCKWPCFFSYPNKTLLSPSIIS